MAEAATQLASMVERHEHPRTHVAGKLRKRGGALPPDPRDDARVRQRVQPRGVLRRQELGQAYIPRKRCTAATRSIARV